MPSPPSGAGAEVAAIRTLALVGPAAAGKTSLAEALLQRAGAIGAPGSARARQHRQRLRPDRATHAALAQRLRAAPGARAAPASTSSTRPARPDFLGQSLPALEAVETAAVVINAATGIEPMAVRMMEYAASRQLDRLIIVNKIDAPGVDLPGAAGADPGRVRQGVPAAEPARCRRHAGSSTASTTARAQRLRQRRCGAPRAGRAGGRGRRRLRRPLPQRRRRRRQPSCTRRWSRRCAKAT